MTKLENLVFSHPEYKALDEYFSREERQDVLDKISEEVVAQLSPQEICEHVVSIYDATAGEYANNPHTKNVIDELVMFMSMLPDKAKVLDVGCGLGRDALFMSIDDKNFRGSLMGRVKNGKSTLDKFDIPEKIFEVSGIDLSLGMLKFAQSWMVELRRSGLLKTKVFPVFGYTDMHDFSCYPRKSFDGIWSCTSLFEGTPRKLLDSAMRSVARIIKQDGVLFLTYTSEPGPYNKLLLSSTGYIKYFANPKPEKIAALARKYGFVLLMDLRDDFIIKDKVIKKDLFVSQFFRMSR